MADSIIEKIKESGFSAASTIELLAIAISEDESDIERSKQAAKKLMQDYKNIRNFKLIGVEDLRKQTGLGDFRSLQMLAIMELGRRSYDAGKGETTRITSPEDVYEVFRHLKDEKKEHFCLLMLDAKNQIIKKDTVHIGTISASIVGIKECFREAIKEGAAGVIAVHNHPSGDPTPSREDFEVTRALKEAGKLLEIPLLDHVIIGETGFCSMQRLGAIA